MRSLGAGRYSAAVKVTNTGIRPGEQVVQVYVGDPSSAGEPPRQLKGYAKVALRAGRSRTVHVTLGPQSFQVYSDSAGRFVTPAGRYRIYAGTSSRNLPLRTSVSMG